MKLVDCGLVALLWSYGVIWSPRWLLPAIQSPAKNKSHTTGCLSTRQFNLYNKSDGDSNEIQRTRLPKLHSLSFAYLSILLTTCNWRRGLIWHPPHKLHSISCYCSSLAALLLILSLAALLLITWLQLQVQTIERFESTLWHPSNHSKQQTSNNMMLLA